MKRPSGLRRRTELPREPHFERFKDRAAAGKLLAKYLGDYADRPDVLVLGLPRGGVPVAFEVAQALHAPLDALVVRKLPTPGQPELAMGAVAPGDIMIVNREVTRNLQIPESTIEAVAAEERRELAMREERFRGARPPLDVRNRTVILVDDGLATGSTMRAAVVALSRQRPARLIIAVPVGARWAPESLRPQVDEVVCLMTPDPFFSIGEWYEDFLPVPDSEVRRLLDAAAEIPARPAPEAAEDEHVSHR